LQPAELACASQLGRAAAMAACGDDRASNPSARRGAVWQLDSRSQHLYRRILGGHGVWPRSGISTNGGKIDLLSTAEITVVEQLRQHLTQPQPEPQNQWRHSTPRCETEASLTSKSTIFNCVTLIFPKLAEDFVCLRRRPTRRTRPCAKTGRARPKAKRRPGCACARAAVPGRRDLPRPRRVRAAVFEVVLKILRFHFTFHFTVNLL
jgi:hypothetical protein